MWFVRMLGCGHEIYAACGEPADCAAPDGVEAACLDKYSAGFCTWRCATDDDCAFDEDAYARVCAPFEDEADQYCFPSCELGEACPDGTSCRSTGGGSDNRKVCFPDDAASDPASTPSLR